MGTSVVNVVLVALLSFASASIAAPSGNGGRGRVAFAQCAGCHSMIAGRNGFGPTLYGVGGRPVGSVPGYVYSKALKEARGRTWSAAAMDAFLAAPSKVYPGTKMGSGVVNPQTRADIVAYLTGSKAK